MSLSPGTRIAHYEILTALGAGGMGEVYRARDVRLGRDIAIKVLRPEALGNRERVQRFLAEARVVAALNHPNVLTLHDFGESEHGPYLVTELVDGQTLRQRLAGGRLEPATAIDLVLQACDGLAKAHDAGIIHRDIKPENIMLTRDGIAKILDFGLAKLRRSDSDVAELVNNPTLTASGVLVGTPTYVSPEQLGGARADARSDVFGLGILLFEMLYGVNPFRRDNPIETMHAILTADPMPAPVRAGIPDGVVAVIRRALAKDPAARFADARDMAAALRAASLPPPARTGRRARRGWAGVAAGVGAVLLVVFLVGVFRNLAAPRPQPDAAPVAAASRGDVPDMPAVAYPQGRLGVAIVPILDQSHDAMLAEAGIGRILADAFVQILVDFPSLYVIDRYRLESVAMTLGRSIDDAAKDNAFAREVGTRAQAQALLSGTLSRLSGVYLLNATLTDLSTGVVLESFRAQSESATMLLTELTRSVGGGMQRQYGTQTGATAVDSVATASLDAYTHYVRGDDLILEGDWSAAARELERAAQIDPEMGLAWVGLACAHSFAGEDVPARAAFARALQCLNRLNDQQRRWVEMDGIWINTQDGDLYLEAMHRYVRDYPDDHRNELYTGLAWQWLKGDCTKALEWYEKGARMMPSWYPITKARVDCLLETKRVDEARRVLREYLALPFIPEHGRQQATGRMQEIGTDS